MFQNYCMCKWDCFFKVIFPLVCRVCVERFWFTTSCESGTFLQDSNPVCLSITWELLTFHWNWAEQVLTYCYYCTCGGSYVCCQSRVIKNTLSAFWGEQDCIQPELTSERQGNQGRSASVWEVNPPLLFWHCYSQLFLPCLLFFPTNSACILVPLHCWCEKCLPTSPPPGMWEILAAVPTQRKSPPPPVKPLKCLIVKLPSS